MVNLYPPLFFLLSLNTESVEISYLMYANLKGEYQTEAAIY